MSHGYTTGGGTPLPERNRVAFAQFQSFVARAHGRCTLMAELHDRENHRVPEAEACWIFEDELPLNTIREDLAALLRPAGDLDATIKVSFNDNYQLSWNACEFDVHLASEPRGLVPIPAVIDDGARVAGRAIGDPVRERDFGQYALAGQPNHRPITLPSVEGCWLIYLRNGERVLTRPYLYLGQSLGPLPSGKLGRAMAIADRKARMSALESFCDEAESDGERGSAGVHEIIELASRLDGLPPSTFDVFHLLPSRPLLAARLLFEAGEQEVPALVALDAGLPFAWPLIAKCHWDRAAKMRFNVLLGALPDTLPDRLALAAEAIGKSRGRIAALVPMTAPLLNQPSPNVPISEAAQIFMQRASDRAEALSGSPFRPGLEDFLPAWEFDAHFWRALDAPCAAARAAREELTLSEAQIRCVKDVARRYPRYFLDAFAAILKGAPLG